jgi:ADP-ribosylation factor-like protein 8
LTRLDCYFIINLRVMSWYFNSFVSWLKSKLWSREIEISIVGLQNAGKSTLMGTLATGGFNEDTIPTIGFNYKRMKKGKVGMNVWDLGGQ